MADVSDKDMALARVYSGAMLELAQAQGDANVLREELSQLADSLDRNPQLESFFSNPNVDIEKRKATIEKIYRGRVSDLLVDSIQILNHKGRLGLLRSIVEAYRLGHEKLLGRVDVYVRSAVPLTDSLRARVLELAEKRTGKEPKLVETVEESLVGGLVMQIGDEKLDACVATRLQALGHMFRERASREIHSGRSHVREAIG